MNHAHLARTAHSWAPCQRQSSSERVQWVERGWAKRWLREESFYVLCGTFCSQGIQPASSSTLPSNFIHTPTHTENPRHHRCVVVIPLQNKLLSHYHMHVLLFGGFDLPLTLTIPRGKTSRGDMKEITSACLEIPRGERLRRSTQCVSRSKACCQSSGANLHALPGDSGCPAVSIHGRERGRWSTGANPSLRGVDGKQQSRRLLELLSLLMSRGD